MLTFGTHYLLTVVRSEREKVREFYTSLLGCTLRSSEGITRNIPEHVDLFEFSGQEVVGVQYVESADKVLNEDECRRACWMELKTDDVEGLQRKLLDFGVQEITDFWDTGHFYFHAPGGQVYRIIHIDE